MKKLWWNATKKRKILIGCAIGSVTTIGLSIGLSVGLTQCKETRKIISWEVAKEYFNVDANGVMLGFKGATSSDKYTSNLNFTKTCSTGGYNALEFDSEVTSIHDYAFKNCAAFEYGSSIKYISMLSVSSIGNDAFYGCASLTKIDFSNVASIGEGAFNGCARLTSISIPKTGLTLSVTNSTPAIGTNAFRGCVKFTGFTGGALKISNTSSNPSIGIKTFYGCAKLDVNFIKKIDLSGIGGNAQKLSCHYDGKKYAYIAPEDFKLGTNPLSDLNSGCLFAGSVPSNALSSSIGYSAFQGCASLTKIDFSNVTSIGEGAFLGCASLTKIDLSNITSIDEAAFAYCANTMFQGAPALSSIGSYAFAYCANLSKKFVKGIKSIEGCTLKENGTSGYAWRPNSKTTSIIDAGCLAWGNLGDYSKYVTSIGNAAFYGCASLTKIDFSNVASIGEGAFNGCARLTSISIPKTGLTLSANVGDPSSTSPLAIPAIDLMAFRGCVKFTGFIGGPLKIVNSTNTIIDGTPVPSIGLDAFYGCAKLDVNFIKKIDLSGIGGNAQKLSCHYDGKKYAYIAPEDFKLGTNPLFDRNSGCLFAGSVPSNTLSSSISSYAFNGCASLTKIDLSNVTSIGENAFQGCASLTKIDLSNTTSIGQNTFADCPKLKNFRF